ncbi:MAG: hypothetical protein N3D11_16745, partial [Candidatus Sumerlaeia bacterium]|nr:hypothetical protein [Candidatus Sumerlaeia bacterium]
MLALVIAAAASPLPALWPPRPDQIERYRQDGSLAARLEFTKTHNNHRVSAALIQRKLAELRALEEGKAFRPEAFPYSTGLPATGSPKIFALLIDFPDYPHTQDAAFISSRLFGNGDSAEYPYESLRNYYQRSSYNQLNIQGNVLPWYRAPNNRGTYDSTAKTVALIKEALAYHDPTHD